MSYSVLIVESPEKARAIFSMLGSGWKVFATRGHICDLPEKQYGITQKDDDFQGKLVLKPHAKEVLQTIRQAITPDTPVYLATDDDFEGERIAHDVAIALKLTDYKRIAFSEISESAILEAIQNPRPLDIAKLNAQKARRLIDRITGYPGSHAIKKDFEQLGLPYDPQGIGRSIAPALKLLCEVEEAKQEFEDNPPEEAKMIRAKYNVDGLEFVGMLSGAYTANMYLEMEEKCNLLSRNKAVVSKVKPNSTHKAPPKPLTTSSYQYGMFYLYGIKPKEAMQIAQTLYNLGFISYPRTDSHRVPLEKAIAYMDYILQHFGEEYCHDVTRCYEKDISEGAQNAHPALLPTKAIPTHYPNAIFDFWGRYGRFRKLRENDKFLKAYHFIFYRAIASQMANARYSTTIAHIESATYVFEAKENFLSFDGWKKLSGIITEDSDEDAKEGDFSYTKSELVRFPELEVGQVLDNVSYFTVNTVSHSPRRYGVGRFVSTLFKMGVVRPSTMDKIVETLEGKGYIAIEGKIVIPTTLGKRINAWVNLEFPELNDLKVAKEFQHRVESCASAEEANALIQEYHNMTFGILKRKKIHYNETDGPSEKELEYVAAIAEKKGITKDPVAMSAKERQELIKSDKKERYIGKCPECGMEVLEQKNSFGCSAWKGGCKFTLWKKSVTKFLEIFEVPWDEEMARALIANALRKTPMTLKLRSPRNGAYFEKKIICEKNNQGYWGIGMKDEQKKTKGKE